MLSFGTAAPRTRLPKMSAFCLHFEQQNWDISAAVRKLCPWRWGKICFSTTSGWFFLWKFLAFFFLQWSWCHRAPEWLFFPFPGHLCSFLWSPFLQNISSLLPQEWIWGLCFCFTSLRLSFELVGVCGVRSPVHPQFEPLYTMSRRPGWACD